MKTNTVKNINNEKTSEIRIEINEKISFYNKWNSHLILCKDVSKCCYTVLYIFCKIPILIVCVLSILIYIIIGITVLINQKYRCDACLACHLWEYILSSLIVLIISKFIQLIQLKIKGKNISSDKEKGKGKEKSKEKDKANNNYNLLVCNNYSLLILSTLLFLVIEIAFSIWGYLELYILPKRINSDIHYVNNTILYNNHTNNYNTSYISCIDLIDSDLWIFGLVTFIIMVIDITITLLRFMLTIYYPMS